jgi:hypothetical protein
MSPYNKHECRNQDIAESSTVIYGSASLLMSLPQAPFRCIYCVCLQDSNDKTPSCLKYDTVVGSHHGVG